VVAGFEQSFEESGVSPPDRALEAAWFRPVGFFRNLLGLDLEPPAVDPDALSAALDQAETFDVTPAGLAGFGIDSTLTPGPAPRVDRRSAIQVPAVKRSRDLIAGVLGGLPIDVFDADRNQVRCRLLEQPERNVPRSVTMARTFEDMLFEGVAWWKITEFTWDGWPDYVRRLKPDQVTVDNDRGRVMVDGREVPSRELIRFDSPTEGLLIAGARAIRTCLLLDAYAANAAQGIPPMDWFEAEDGVDPFASVLEDETEAKAEEDAAIATFLNGWQEARRTRSTAWIPPGVKYGTSGFDPKVLQLAEQRQHAVLEIAREAGIDPEELGVSTTSRTYANMFERRKAYTDFTLGLYRQAFEDRVSMGDVTPRGQYAKFNLDAFLRSSPAERYAAYKIGLEVGAIGKDEIRPLEDKPALEADQVQGPPTLRALPTRQEGTA
jgi:phage portal protein BeeE